MSAGPLPRQTIRAAFTALGERVSTALRVQIGDAARLNSHRNECLQLMVTIQQVLIFISLFCISFKLTTFEARKSLFAAGSNNHGE